jgi:hypothetical protein
MTMPTYTPDSDRFQEKSEIPSWKHIGALALWLCFATPIGLWKLWHDKVLSRSTKWRIIVYLFFLPVLLYFTVNAWMANRAIQQIAP